MSQDTRLLVAEGTHLRLGSRQPLSMQERLLLRATTGSRQHLLLLFELFLHDGILLVTVALESSHLVLEVLNLGVFLLA